MSHSPDRGRPGSPVSLAVSLLGLAGIVGIFLPFSYGTSISEAIRATLWSDDSFLEELWRVAAPLLLAVPIGVANLRRHLAGPLSVAERAVARALALLAATSLFSLLLVAAEDLSVTGTEDMMWAALWLAVPVVSAVVLARNRRAGVRPEANAVMAMQMIYMGTAFIGLLGFRPWDVGAYFILATVAAYLWQVIRESRTSRTGEAVQCPVL